MISEFILKSTLRTNTFRSRRIHNKASRRTAFAFFRVVIPMKIWFTTLAFLYCGIPVGRVGASYASIILSQMRLIIWTNTLPGILVEHKSLWASHTRISLRVPGTWRRASYTEPTLVQKRLVWASTSIIYSYNLIMGTLTDIR